VSRRSPRGRVLCHAIAAGTYLTIVLFVLRAVLPDPSALLPFPAMLRATQWFRSNVLQLDRQDQAMVVATVARNAHLLTTAPTELLGPGQCHPMPRSHTLGEHMFGVGLLAALPFAATQDPIASFNAALLLGLWIASLSMYAFAFRFLRHPGAAFVAGLAFLLVPARIANPAHPYVPADLWTPLVLLFLDRVFAHGRLRDGLLLGLFASLQVAESLYPLLVCALYVIPFSVSSILRHRRVLAGVIAPLAVAAVPILATVAVVLGPYLQTRAVWGILGDRATFFLDARELGPFQFHFIGWSVAALAAIALVDRVRSRADDPRLALATGAALVAWCAVGELDLFLFRIPSPLVLLRGIVPGLDAVRAMRATASGVDVGSSFLAGFGVLVLIRGRSSIPSLAVSAVAALAVLALPSYGPLSRATFGRLVRLDAYEGRPPAEDVALLREHAEGALLDIPLPSTTTRIGLNFQAAKMLLLASYSPRPTAACYNSFDAATSAEVTRLAGLLPDRGAAEALAALGFGTVLLHKDRLVEADGPLEERFDSSGALRRKGATARLVLYRLPPAPPLQEDPSLLAPLDPGPRLQVTSAPAANLELPVVNPTALLYRQAEPIAPSDVELRWASSTTGETPWTRTRALLPLAIPAGTSAPIRITTATPGPGDYRVELRPADSNGPPLAFADVTVAEAREGLAEK
jgi:hypothetical protein